MPSALEGVRQGSQVFRRRTPGHLQTPLAVLAGVVGNCHNEIGSSTGLYHFQTSVRLSDSRWATWSDTSPVFGRIRQLALALQ